MCVLIIILLICVCNINVMCSNNIINDNISNVYY